MPYLKTNQISVHHLASWLTGANADLRSGKYCARASEWGPPAEMVIRPPLLGNSPGDWGGDSPTWSASLPPTDPRLTSDLRKKKKKSFRDVQRWSIARIQSPLMFGTFQLYVRESSKWWKYSNLLTTKLMCYFRNYPIPCSLPCFIAHFPIHFGKHLIPQNLS